MERAWPTTHVCGSCGGGARPYILLCQGKPFSTDDMPGSIVAGRWKEVGAEAVGSAEAQTEAARPTWLHSNNMAVVRVIQHSGGRMFLHWINHLCESKQ